MKKRWTFLVEIVILLAVCGWIGSILFSDHNSDSVDGISVKVQLANMRDGAVLHKLPTGEMRYRVKMKDGAPIEYSVEEFARQLYEEGRSRSAWEKLLNISSPEGAAWVFLGLLGQILFTGRMVVQLLASEKEKKSVVPPAFWWMSLLGATMLLIYFGWRRDPIGLLGQSFGWFIYVRNLYLIYKKREDDQPALSLAGELKNEASPA